ncbi:hypothetical protein IVZ55_01225 [Salmonella enterica subsp. enterica serovar Worthington]|nr:hypothetical protein [Salmonella enterica subsp. enterica serovar Worthington]
MVHCSHSMSTDWQKTLLQQYLLTICYTTSYHRTTRIAFTPEYRIGT